MHKYDSLMFTRLLSNLLYVNLSIDQIPLILSKPWKMGGVSLWLQKNVCPSQVMPMNNMPIKLQQKYWLIGKSTRTLAENTSPPLLSEILSVIFGGGASWSALAELEISVDSSSPLETWDTDRSYSHLTVNPKQLLICTYLLRNFNYPFSLPSFIISPCLSPCPSVLPYVLPFLCSYLLLFQFYWSFLPSILTSFLTPFLTSLLSLYPYFYM